MPVLRRVEDVFTGVGGVDAAGWEGEHILPLSYDVLSVERSREGGDGADVSVARPIMDVRTCRAAVSYPVASLALQALGRVYARGLRACSPIMCIRS